MPWDDAERIVGVAALRQLVKGRSRTTKHEYRTIGIPAQEIGRELHQWWKGEHAGRVQKLWGEGYAAGVKAERRRILKNAAGGAPPGMVGHAGD